jgi:large subunit ribosomal protein L17
MRHQRTGKKLGRDSAHRRALYANLASELIEHERIKTTITKAKAVKPIAEQMITLGRRGDMHARRQAVAFLGSKDIVHKLFDDLGPRYAERPGGYLRIIRLGPRPGDAAEMAYLELVDTPLVFKERKRPGESSVSAEPAAEAEESGAEAAEPVAETAAEAGEPEPAAEVSDEDEPEAAAPEAETDPASEPVAEAEPGAAAGDAEPGPEGDEPETAADPAAGES